MEQLDQQVLNLAKAIRRTETGGSKDPYNAKGASGEFGGYQFMPATYKTLAKQYLGNENAEPSIENQNKIAYSEIKRLKDAGHNPAEIASIWNSGKADRYKTGGKGINSKGVEYDVPTYVAKVSNHYRELSGGQNTPVYNPKPFSQPTEQSIVPEAPQVDEVTQPKEETLGGKLMSRISQAGTALTDSASGKINPFSGLLQTAGAGAGAIGDVAGAGLGLLNKGANYLTGGLLGKAEDKATELIGKGVEKVANTDIGKSVISSGEKFSQEHPEATGNLKAAGNIAMAVPVVKGVGLAGGLVKGGLEKTFAGATEKAIQKELASAAMRTVGGRKALENVGEDGLKILAKKEIAPVIDSATGKYAEESLKNSYEKIGDLITHVNDSELQPVLDQISKRQSFGQSLETLKKLAIKEAEKDVDLMEAGAVPKAIQQIESRFEGWKHSYGNAVDLGTQNRLKIGSGKFTDWGTPEGSADKAIYRALQKNIESVAKKNGFGDAVETANGKMSQLIKAQKLLKHLSNKKPTMGMIRKVTTNAKGTTKGLLKSGLKKAGAGALYGAGFTGAAKLLEK